MSAILQHSRAERAATEWIATYRANRPLVERKIAHLVRRSWGGRRGRTRGLRRIAADLDTRASAFNWARLATLGLSFGPNGWSSQEAEGQRSSRFGPEEATFDVVGDPRWGFSVIAALRTTHFQRSTSSVGGHETAKSPPVAG